ncbi:amidohydrolase [Alkalihalobacillus sp. FSL W8-0930]
MRHILHTWTGMIEPELKCWRRELHQHAEVGFCEYVTTYFIYKKLLSLDFTLHIGKDAVDTGSRFGVPRKEELEEHEQRALRQGVPREFLNQIQSGHTGVVATLDTGRAGNHIVLRFDIDALPIEEAEEHDHIPSKEGFRSRNAGVMHACGHDGHTAIGLGIARFLHQHKEQLNGRYTLLFQPAEEGSRGANAMVAKGWLEDADLFLSGHLGIHSLPVGTIVARATGILATSKLDVKIKGKTAHAGMSPHEGKNALLAASSMVLALHSIAPHGEGATRINVGTLQAGTGRNIVPGEATLQLETRGATTLENQYMKEEATRRIQGAALMYGVDADIEIVGEGVTAETDSYWAKQIPRVLAQSTVVTDIHPELELNGSEDVTYMMKATQQAGGKAAYMIYGTPLAAGHHHRLFDFDEGALPVAVNALAYLICAENGQGILEI